MQTPAAYFRGRRETQEAQQAAERSRWIRLFHRMRPSLFGEFFSRDIHRHRQRGDYRRFGDDARRRQYRCRTNHAFND